MTLDDLLELTQNIKQEIASLSWHEDDVRHSFFGLYYSSISDYYIGKVSFQLAEYLGSGDVMFTSSVYSFNPHAKRLYEIQDHPLLRAGYHNDLNRYVVFGVWTSFEFSVSLIFDYLVTEHEYETIVKQLNAKLIKVISKLEERSKTLVFEVLKKSSFVPLMRKFDFISKRLDGCYGESRKDDRKFVEFVSKLRNCMIHSNGFYKGGEFTYNFAGTDFEFRNKEMFNQRGTNQFVYFEIALKLKEIFVNITKCTKDIEFVEYPEDGFNVKFEN
jgi:hypothetical protein